MSDPFSTRSPFRWKYASITVTTTVDYYNVLLSCTPAADITVNLPTAVGATGAFFEIRNDSAFIVTVDPAGAQTINGAATYPLTITGESLTVVSDGANWIICSLPTFGVSFANNQRNSIGVSLDGGGAVITTGPKGSIVCPFAGTIYGWDIVADQVGSIVVDVWKANNAVPTVANTITAAAKPTLTADQQEQSTTLTGWTTSVAEGDVFKFNVDSATTITQATVALRVLRT